uniref:Uncharacterized protein n=1 Tax=Geospiza parvula TaxID=87175 RepID=A0A8C3N1C1_GEOPR
MGQCNCRKKRKDCQELTDVERAIETVISQFHCYAVKGQKEYLTPNEMQELVVQKLPHLGKVREAARRRWEGSWMGVGPPGMSRWGPGWDGPPPRGTPPITPMLSPQCVGPLEEKIECMGDPNEAKLEFGEYWDMMGDAAKGCRRK